MRTGRILGLAAAASLATSVQARADMIQFQGVTRGCFYSSSESGCTPGSSSTLLFLTYLSGTFNVTSDVSGQAGLHNLGSFSVTGDPASYVGSHFLLDVI